jgi:hypothetical protein
MFKDIMNPTKTSILNQMNPPQTMQVEEEVILFNAPIKNQNKGNNVSFHPIVESLVV